VSLLLQDELRAGEGFDESAYRVDIVKGQYSPKSSIDAKK